MPDKHSPAGGEAVRPDGRVYTRPVLKVYGAVAVLTSAVDMAGRADGGPNNTRT